MSGSVAALDFELDADAALEEFVRGFFALAFFDRDVCDLELVEVSGSGFPRRFCFIFRILFAVGRMASAACRMQHAPMRPVINAKTVHLTSVVAPTWPATMDPARFLRLAV